MGAFIEADIGKLESFKSQSLESISEFAKIKEDFGTLNTNLLAKWKGVGADAYKYETDHIIMAPLSRQKSDIFLMNRKYQNVE